MIRGITLACAATAALLLMAACSTTPAPEAMSRATIADTTPAPIDALELKLPKLAKAGFDVGQAQPFPSPNGPGFVVRNESTNKVCIGIPGIKPGDRGTVAMACDEIVDVERRGMEVEIVGDLGVDPAATDVFAFLLPHGAQNVVLKTPTSTVSVAVRARVAVGQLTTRGSLTWTVGSTPQSHFFAGPFLPSKVTLITCHSQNTATAIPPQPQPTTLEQAQQLNKRLQAEYCR